MPIQPAGVARRTVLRKPIEEGSNGSNKIARQCIHAIHGRADGSLRRNRILLMGSGKVSLILGLIAVLYSLWSFIKIKPLEGKVAMKMQPAALQLAGVAVGFLGWAFVLFGLHLTSSVSGRLATTLIGFAVTLIGVLYLLPKASSKNAIWKA